MPGEDEEYAFFAWGLLELYAAQFRIADLEQACELSGQLLERFFDHERGGFYPYASDAEQLLTRNKDTYDGALPSGNAVAALVLSRLARLTGEPRWRDALEQQLGYLAGAIAPDPSQHSFTLLTLLEEFWPAAELVCTAKETPEELKAFLRERSRPGLTVLVKTRAEGQRLAALAPFTAAYCVPETGARYYLCRGRSCASPVERPEQLRKLL